ncbi:MAG: precorrin-3B C(17)-methyltransferase [Candidatus Anammoxibacter sp.]
MVGIGPGRLDEMSLRAVNALKSSDIVVGYKLYLDLVKEIIKDKATFSSGMRKEMDRAKMAVSEAIAGKVVSIISSGDPGTYGMAGLVLEIVSQSDHNLPIEIIAGITSANASAALLGAPLMHDHVVISLSDLLTPWETIENRIELAAKGDFVIAIYNPMSKKRDWQIKKTFEIFLRYKSASTCVGIVRNASREDEDVILTTLDKALENDIDMKTMIIVGNSTTFFSSKFMVTKRGYNNSEMAVDA